MVSSGPISKGLLRWVLLRVRVEEIITRKRSSPKPRHYTA